MLCNTPSTPPTKQSSRTKRLSNSHTGGLKPVRPFFFVSCSNGLSDDKRRKAIEPVLSPFRTTEEWGEGRGEVPLIDVGRFTLTDVIRRKATDTDRMPIVLVVVLGPGLIELSDGNRQTIDAKVWRMASPPRLGLRRQGLPRRRFSPRDHETSITERKASETERNRTDRDISTTYVALEFGLLARHRPLSAVASLRCSVFDSSFGCLMEFEPLVTPLALQPRLKIKNNIKQAVLNGTRAYHAVLDNRIRQL